MTDKEEWDTVVPQIGEKLLVALRRRTLDGIGHGVRHTSFV